jgi:hypothetical protein
MPLNAEYVEFMRSIRVAIGTFAVRLGLPEKLRAHGMGA